jgi:hypothetical protein
VCLISILWIYIVTEKTEMDLGSEFIKCRFILNIKIILV